MNTKANRDYVAQLIANLRPVTYYVTDKASGEIVGAIVPHEGRYVLCAGYTLDTSIMVACRDYKRHSRARARAADILNGGAAVSCAPVL